METHLYTKRDFLVFCASIGACLKNHETRSFVINGVKIMICNSCWKTICSLSSEQNESNYNTWRSPGVLFDILEKRFADQNGRLILIVERV